MRFCKENMENSVNIYKSNKYLTEIKKVSLESIFNGFNNKNILLTGGTGLILSYLVDVLLTSDFNGKLFLVTRGLSRAKERFFKFCNDKRLVFIEGELDSFKVPNERIDYIIGGASKTDPYSYANFPTSIILDNIYGTKYLLDIAKIKKSKFLFLSSVEIYGITDNLILNEDDLCTYNVRAQRSCYNLAKATCENLCLAYAGEYGVKFNAIRLSRIFGPTVKLTDTKAMTQFINKALNKEDIVLKSKGEQIFNYQYVADTIRGIAYVLLKGKDNEVYNCTNNEEHSLKELAEYIASLANKKVVFDFNDDFQGKGYSVAKNAIMNISKLEGLGFQNKFKVLDSLKGTLQILNEIYK